MSKHLVFGMTGGSRVVGGIATANRNVLRALVGLAAERDLRLTVLSFLESGADRPSWLPSGVEFKGFRGEKGRFSVELVRSSLSHPLFCFDHVTLAQPLIPLAVAGLARTVIFTHGSESWRRLRWASKLSFRAAVLCLTNSEFTLRKMRERMPWLRGTVCLLGLSPEIRLQESIVDSDAAALPLFVAANGEERRLGDRVLLMVARMDPSEREKGHQSILRVLPDVVREFPMVQVVFAGPGEDREALRALACERGVGGSVFLPGWVPLLTLEELYRSCYAYVMPSRQEGFGLAYLEAMNYGKPCIGCRDQGAEDVIKDGETGFLVSDPDDRQELARVLLTLLRDQALARQLGRNGFDRLHLNFTAQQHQKRVRRQIGQLV